MLRLLKLIIFLALVAFFGVTGYAFIGDMTPDRTEISQPVELNVVK